MFHGTHVALTKAKRDRRTDRWKMDKVISMCHYALLVPQQMMKRVSPKWKVGAGFSQTQTQLSFTFYDFPFEMWCLAPLSYFVFCAELGSEIFLFSTYELAVFTFYDFPFKMWCLAPFPVLRFLSWAWFYDLFIVGMWAANADGHTVVRTILEKSYSISDLILSSALKIYDTINKRLK